MNAATKDDADALLVTLKAGQLRELMREELERARAEMPQAPALIDQRELARNLGLSERTVYTLRGEGLPTIMIGDSPRFELAAVLVWLRNRQGGGCPAPAPKSTVKASTRRRVGT